MDSSASAVEGGYNPPFSHKTTRDILKYIRITSPIVLLVIFLVTFLAQSVISARGSKNVQNGVRTGPGGRPLPQRTRSTAFVSQQPIDFTENVKSVFKWLSVVVLVSFVVDAAFNMVHVLLYRHENWWCGQSVVVSSPEHDLLSKAV